MMINKQHAAAFAPATTSNLAVVFDILGFPLQTIGDEVWLQKRADNALVISKIDSADDLPMDSEKNTATVAIAAMQKALGCSIGLDVTIKKGIPLGSGLGGSAASSVAAVVAFNHMLAKPLTPTELVPYALAGEQAATGSIHADNVVPCLFGGLVLVHSLQPLSIIQLPTNHLWSVFIHPQVVIETKHARSVLPQNVPLPKVVQYSARLAAFISALYTDDMALLADACRDELIEPYRQSLIPHFQELQNAAKSAGALACSISGAGPTVFALCQSEVEANHIGHKMADIYLQHNIGYELIISTVSPEGARSIGHDDLNA